MPQKTAIVLAAGLGTRMKSNTPKVLHKVAGRSMIRIVVEALEAAGVDEIRVVVGFGGDLVRQELKDRKEIKFYAQEKQLGTADAVKSADLNSIFGTVMICNGDHPLIKAEDYKAALDKFAGHDLLVVGCMLRNPTSFGRIVRDKDGRLSRIVEEKEATDIQKKIQEVNTGLYVVKSDVLKKFLPEIKNLNSKKEFYLTDLIYMALDKKLNIDCHKTDSARVGKGVNNHIELSQAGRQLYLRKARELFLSGVVIVDPATTYVEWDVKIGAGSVIEPGCMIKGKTVIGDNCIIEAHCQIVDSKIASNCSVKWGSLIDKSIVGAKSIVGPYARLRPESELGEEVHIGNFVELKKTKMARGSKANHLTYLGDAEIGEETNIGCGTITCNYAPDKKKYKTVIGKKAFIGSDTQFIAPVTIGDGAVIGSGSTITKDVPAGALGVARSKQFIKQNYNKE